MFGIAYAVDGDGLILGFSRGPFLDDERDGGAVPWNCSDAVGTNLFAHVNGVEVRDSFRALHEAVWKGRRTAVGFEYRCDEPEIERRMHMSLSLIGDEHAPAAVLYQSIVISETPRVPIPLFAADILTGRRAARPGARIVKLCSYCQKVSLPVEGLRDEADWVDPEVYYRRGGDTKVSVSHSVCGVCFNGIVAPALRNATAKGALGGEALRLEEDGQRNVRVSAEGGSRG